MATRTRSGLNPDAAPYVPAAQRAVEDFSSEWWDLVHSSPWFADYWLRERFHESVLDFAEDDDPELPDDINDALFSLSAPLRKPSSRISLSLSSSSSIHRVDLVFVGTEKEAEEEEGGGGNREVITWGAEKWKASRGCAAEGAKYAEKAAKAVSMKLSPRTIQQPRPPKPLASLTVQMKQVKPP
ncbi:hypothetical protein B296_00033409 [Ensete ventricosum]|uniref:Ataxin-2 C-terminal domain-containing protein n=1 Tax=Ensete ventricosum TaxID=4639 RepID=A0A427A7J0_ENSVE|nr:hypothetical protein B296_00033409 [Ensete ventricosum]